MGELTPVGVKELSRVFLSLGSLLTGALIFALLWLHGAHGENRASLVFGVLLLTILLALPVWLLILPVVLWLNNAEGWRGGLTLVLGISIGPSAVFLWQYSASGHVPVGPGDQVSYLFAGVVGAITTLSYVLSLRWLTRRVKARNAYATSPLGQV